MYRALVLSAILSVVSSTLAGAPVRAAGDAGGFPWFSGEVADALRAAREQDRKLIVVVSTSWCEPCRRLKTNVFASDEMKSLANQFLAVEVDAESVIGRPFAEKHTVQRYPTTLFMNQSGVEEGRIVGFRELPGFMHTVRQWLDGTLVAPQAKVAESELADRWARAFRAAYTRHVSAAAELEALARDDASNEAGVGGLARLALGEHVQLGGGDPKAAAAMLAALRRELGGTQAARLAAFPLARAMAENGKIDKGLAELLAQVKKEPDNRNAVWHVARFAWLYPKANQAKALAVARQGLDRFRDFDELWDLVGKLEERRGKGAAARAAWEKARALRPELPYYAQRSAPSP